MIYFIHMKLSCEYFLFKQNEPKLYYSLYKLVSTNISIGILYIIL